MRRALMIGRVARARRRYCSLAAHSLAVATLIGACHRAHTDAPHARMNARDIVKESTLAIAGIDRGHDLALVRIAAAKPLPTLRFGDSTALAAGDQIYAIGNPIGLNDTISSGLVSQVRELAPDLTILQISAPISPGSSGG